MSINQNINSIINNIDIKQNKKNILILSGGSFKGFAYIGVLKALKKLNLLNDLNIFIGTSVGSIFSLLLSLNSCIEEIEEFINKINFNQLMNFNIKNLYCNYGLNDGSTIINLLISFLNKKNFNQNLTFKELYERTNNILIINSSNITKKINEVFDYLLTPDMEILKVVRMSISVPFIFSPVKFNNCLYVDGGIINSFMYIWAIKNRYKKDNIIGVLLNDKINKNQNYNFYSYLMDIYYSLYSNQTEELNLDEIINIEIDNCSISKTNISDIEKNKMIELGFNKTLEYFKN